MPAHAWRRPSKRSLQAGELFLHPAGNNDFYDVSLDDDRFLMARYYGSNSAMSFILVLNFFEELKCLVPN